MGDRKNTKEGYWTRFTVALGRTNHQIYPIQSKTYSSDLNWTFDYVFYPPQTDSESQLTVIRPITSQVLSPTLTNLLYWTYWTHILFHLSLGYKLWPYRSCRSNNMVFFFFFFPFKNLFHFTDFPFLNYFP